MSVKILFINFGRENLGIEWLSAAVKKAGFSSYLAHDEGLFTQEDNVFYHPLLARWCNQKKALLKKVRAIQPDVIGFSVYTPSYRWACEIASEIKKECAIPIIFGGYHPTVLPRECMENDFVDFVIRGEGDHALVELMQAIKRKELPSAVPNVLYKNEGKIVENPLRGVISNLDTLPLLDKDLFAAETNYRSDYMTMTARGCLYQCSYCGETALTSLYGRTYFRRRSVSSVLHELQLMKQRYQFRSVLFFDSVFFSDKNWLREFSCRYKTDINVPYKCFGHVTVFDREIAHLLKESGCYVVNFGVQTFNDNVRTNILHRIETREHIERAFAVCDAEKLSYDIDIMFGLPYIDEQDYEDVLKAVSCCVKLNRIKTYYTAYYPGVPLMHEARRVGILSETEVNRIAQGCVNDWFHVSPTKDVRRQSIERKYQKIFKVYALIPSWMRSYIVRYRLYRFAAYFPWCIVILLQVVNALIKGDHRFRVQYGKYPYYLRNSIKKKR